jgi:hypothetical protein
MSGSAPLDGLSAHARPAPFTELLIDSEEDRTLRWGLVGMLRETYRGQSPA